MILVSYSVRDEAVEAFLPPMFFRAHGEALRAFMTAAANPEHQFFAHASQFVLYRIGEWDDSSSKFSWIEPVRVASALEVRVSDNQRPAS